MITSLTDLPEMSKVMITSLTYLPQMSKVIITPSLTNLKLAK